ncbi:MAG: penicillin-binding protein activator [Bdellovibrionales bacterium]|nr:penicillin-binding protein activator [Bdellovibrionales bacterium]
MRFLALFFSVFILINCSTFERKQAPKKALPNSAAKLEKIKQDVKRKKYSLALKELDQLILETVSTDISDDAHMLAGEVALKLKDHDLAYKYFLGVVNSNVYSPLEGLALTKATESLVKLGKFDEALSLAQKGLSYRNLPKEEETKLYQLKFSILIQLGDKLEAFDSLVYLSKNHPTESEQMAFRFKALDYIESSLSNEELYQVARRGRTNEFRAYAYFKLGQDAFELRKFDLARDYLNEVTDLHPDSEISERSVALVKQIDARRTVEPKTIGAILPLTGKHSAVAYKTLRGLQMGLGIFGDNPSEFKLAVIDSEGNPDAARRAVERLVTEDHVMAIVGSLLSRTAVAVASKANELGVPSIALSQKSRITDVGEYVYRNALTSEMQIAELVRVAISERGMKKFAILFPNDNYGVEYANLFWDHVLARGGQIVGTQSYEPKETDFRNPLARLVGKFYPGDRQQEYKLLAKDWYKKQKYINARIEPPDDLLKPIVDFDALFIPDSTRAVGQIAPMLAFHDIGKMTLIGTNLWNTPSLVRRGQNFVEGSVFVDSLLLEDKNFKNSEFYRNYYRTFKTTPGVFASQGYDAGLILRQIITSGIRSRIGVKEKLDELSNFPGSIGLLNTNSRREFTRPLVKLGVVDGSIVKNPN